MHNGIEVTNKHYGFLPIEDQNYLGIQVSNLVQDIMPYNLSHKLTISILCGPSQIDDEQFQFELMVNFTQYIHLCNMLIWMCIYKTTESVGLQWIDRIQIVLLQTFWDQLDQGPLHVHEEIIITPISLLSPFGVYQIICGTN